MRLKTLNEIGKLEDKLEESLSKEEEERIDEEIRELGKLLTLPRRVARKERARKMGKNITKEVVQALRSGGCSYRKINELTGVSLYKLKQLSGEYFGGGIQVAKTKAERKKRLEKAKKLLKTTDWPVAKIVRETGATSSNVYYHSRIIRKEHVASIHAD